MGLAVERGWTYFGIVTQDYTVPDHVLRASGWDTIDLDLLTMDHLEPEEIHYDSLEPDAFTVASEVGELHVIRRGVIGLGRVGYT